MKNSLTEKFEEKIRNSDYKELYKDIVEIIKLNQEMVNEIVKANDALRVEVSKLPSKIDLLVSKLDELISFIKAGVEGEEVKEFSSEKIDELIEMNKKIIENNKAILMTLEEIISRLKRPVLKKPLFPKKL